MSKTVKFPLPATGIDVLSAETSLIKGAVRSAVNVDIGRGGQFSRREGQTLALGGMGLHSLFKPTLREFVMIAEDTAVVALVEEEGFLQVARLNSADPLNYAEYNENIYWVNRTTAQWLPPGSYVARPVGVPTPENVPTLSAGAGSLLPGKYAVCFTYIDERGEESGATQVTVIDLPQGGGIVASNLPLDHMDWQLRAYITDPDGEQLRSAAQFPAVFPTYNIAEVARGAECTTQYLVPLRPGEFITKLAGRLYTAVEDTLSFSNAMRPHLYNPAHNFIKFSGSISFIEAVGDGIYVGDDRGIWFLDGTDPEKFALRPVSTRRAVRNSSLCLPPSCFDPERVRSQTPVAVWLGESGYIVGMDGGTIVELQSERVKVPAGLSGRSVFLLNNGIKQIITPVNSGSTAVFGTARNSTIQ